MPYSNDKKRLREAETYLCAPRRRFRAAFPNGQIHLDPGKPGQRLFHSVLFNLILAPDRTHPWDRMIGRSFSALESYFSWVLPHPDRLVIATNTAARVAQYMLPVSQWRCRDAPFRGLTGIPGLRVEGFSNRTIECRHLLTGALLHLEDTSPSSANEMRRQLKQEVKSRTHSTWYPTADNPLTSEELDAWRVVDSSPTDLSELQAALFSRIDIWRKDALDIKLIPEPESAGGKRLEWTHGPHCQQVRWILAHSKLRVPGLTCLTDNIGSCRARVELRTATMALHHRDPFPAPRRHALPTRVAA